MVVTITTFKLTFHWILGTGTAAKNCLLIKVTVVSYMRRIYQRNGFKT